MSIKVLDKGYVRLVTTMGQDVSVVNAARVSFNKSTTVITERDKKLLRFLLRNDHLSPFRHAAIAFEVKAPLMVARQWWKYVVGSDHSMDGWNEVSRRYVEEDPEFYIPEVWRSAPDNKKQGSGEERSPGHSQTLSERLREDTIIATAVYQKALQEGICAEQARLFLPANAMYTTWWWTASLQSVLHFLDQRVAHDAQWEIQQYAQVVEKIVEQEFGWVHEAWKEVRGGSGSSPAD
jgi:thymidylate synthase (FAD)